MTFMGRLGVLVGMLLCCFVLVWCGWHLALWAARTGRINLRKGARG